MPAQGAELQQPRPVRKARRRSRPDGFTLIELVVVLVIMGLMLGLLLTRGPMRHPTLEVRAAAARVAQGLRVARARAIALNRRVSFSLDLTGHDFRIDNAPPQALPETLRLAMLTIAGKASRQQNIGTISFGPDGSSSGGRIELDGDGMRLLVGVDWLSGRVSVADER